MVGIVGNPTRHETPTFTSTLDAIRVFPEIKCKVMPTIAFKIVVFLILLWLSDDLFDIGHALNILMQIGYGYAIEKSPKK